MHAAPSAAIPEVWLLPFIVMLSVIAVFPLFWERFWEHNNNKLLISVLLSLPVTVYLITGGHGGKLFETVVFDYIPFIILLGALFTITGGIYLSGDIEATPGVNTLFMLVGAVLASVMGTTGAAMLLIRPLIQTNKERSLKVHTILFFIGIVANVGGLLTPLGDPPLFMMYLRGTPFTWFFSLFPEWLAAVTVLLVIYYCTDRYFHRREPAAAIAADRTNIRPIKLQGTVNFFFLAGVVLAVALINENVLPVLGENHYYKFTREAVILLMAFASLLFTPRLVRVSNSFTWSPILEVAYLFIGIFVTMVPCLLYLESHATVLGVTSPSQFYFYSGALSSFLDNTPTAVTFHSLALGLQAAGEGTAYIAGIPTELLRAICVGAVFFGSMTYIGNGPNFMVKAVAEENNIRMPHFFGYMYKFSLIVLLPVFILVWFVFIK